MQKWNRLTVGLVILLVLSFASSSDARGRSRHSGRSRVSYSAYSAVRFAGTAQEVAEAKVQYAASRNIRGHCGGGFGGASSEGVGWGSTPQQALNNCCHFRSPLVASATARAASGIWFAIKLFR